jgi:outer membrane protein assembly factor BamB
LENTIKSRSIALTCVLTILLLVSSFAVLASAQTTSSTQTNFGDILQYEWSGNGGDETQSGFSAGPGPETANVLWKIPSSGGSGCVSIFNGKAFVIAGKILRAYDAFDGHSVWNATLERTPTSAGGILKVDDTYLATYCQGVEVRKISDGSLVSVLSIADYGYSYSRMPGSGQYFPGAYSNELKMMYLTSYQNDTSEGTIVAISLANPAQPTIAWAYVTTEASEILSTGDGKVYMGTTQTAIYALDGKTGTFLWRAHKTGLPQQSAFYYDGNLYSAAVAQTMSCFNATTGAENWEYDSSVLGTRAYYAYRGTGGQGRVYDQCISVEPHGWIVCWDAESGDLLWKQPAYFNIAYSTMCMADGKVYTNTNDRTADQVTAGLTMPGYDFTCFDAFTGSEIWRIRGIQFSTPAIAYGNLYGIYGGYIYCIGDTSTAEPWAFGFSGNLDTPRVAVGQTGPSDLSYPKWSFQTGGEVGSSPAVVDGKVYIGSHDQNWYCLDAYTGAEIWSFATGFRVMSSAAVVGGRVYTGSDDGKFYCLDAATGSKVWEHSAGGLIDNIIFPVEWQPRSSPIIVGSKLYAGSLDGKLYCLNIADGSEAWTYTTGGPIGGSPAYSNGVIYITSTDSYMYAINANTGQLVWKSFPLNPGVAIPTYCDMWCAGTPNVADGVVYVGGGSIYGTAVTGYDYTGKNQSRPNGANGGGILLFAFDAATGDSVWNQSLAGNSQAFFIPTYYQGTLYVSEFMHVTAMNASYPTSGSVSIVGFGGDRPGNRTWLQWIGYQILSSALYVDDVRGPKVYISSDVGSVTCIDAITGKAISAYQTKSNVDSSPSVWEGKLYVGSSDGCVYCFDDSPSVDFTLQAESNKGAEMWNNETLAIRGRLMANPMEMTWDYDLGKYVPIASSMAPGLPGATVEILLTKPDMSSVSLTAVTDNAGYFTIDTGLTDVGTWSWLAYFEGKNSTSLTYNQAYSDWHEINVVATPGQTSSPTEQPTETQQPTVSAEPTVTVAPTENPTVTSTPTENSGIPMEYIYAIVAVIVVVVIAIAAYTLTKRKK